MTININRNSVMGIVEGLSVIIAQNNGENTSFEQLWASEDDRKKLDIYYRDAISDLERKLMEWLPTTSAQFSLEYTDESNYVLHLTMHRFWPVGLTGLLKNKIQDYMVHSITAGWLNNFTGVNVKEDYASMAANDLSDVRTIMEQRSFGFTTDTRQQEPKDKPDENDGSSVARQEDKHKPDENDGSSVARQEDKQRTIADGEGLRSNARKTDNVNKGEGEYPYDSLRHKDNCGMRITHDYTDWSGSYVRDYPMHEECPPPPPPVCPCCLYMTPSCKDCDINNN